MKKCLVVLLLFLVGFTKTLMAGPGYRVGDTVASFTLQSMGGRSVSLADYASEKGVIVVFTSPSCPFAKAYEGRLLALSQEFGGQGFPLVVIDAGSTAAPGQDSIELLGYRTKSRSYAYPYLADPGQAVTRIFGATHTPQAFVLQNDGGRFVIRYLGMIDDSPQDPEHVSQAYLANAVASLLAGQRVALPTTRPVGCAIRWKEL